LRLATSDPVRAEGGALKALLRRGLITEQTASPSDEEWRRDDCVAGGVQAMQRLEDGRLAEGCSIAEVGCDRTRIVSGWIWLSNMERLWWA
jgi:hypothetical protein